MRIRCTFFAHGSNDELLVAQVSAVPRVGEWVMLGGSLDKPLRVSMVVYDLHLSSESETQVRVLLER